jgi:hypothetical protein
MKMQGRVQNGVVVLEGESTFPDVTAVLVVSRASPVIRVSRHRRPVKRPLVPSSKPGSLDLTGDMIAEILEDDDVCALIPSLHFHRPSSFSSFPPVR